MDLGCLDLGCISVSEKHNNNNQDAVSGDSDQKIGDSEVPVMSSSPKIGKSKVSKGTGVSPRTSVNKSYSQMKKSFRKGSSPLNWFPRKKVDSYLKRKIRLLQEVGGMTSTLDETLGDSNPHYSRVLREKIAAREAACKAMEARKTAMVEASWCRILKAARIQSKEAETLLQEAEKTVAEAFEAAAALEVIMYDRPDCPRKPCEVESSSINMGGSTTHTVTASFETAFEVDKEVAAAVKAAFIRLANCPSSLHKDEHKDLLWRINQNPDMNEATEEVSECSSGCESDTRSELELESLADSSSNKLIDMMLERLKCLQEDELASLATIVATCGLNAVLLEVENTKHHASGLDYNFKPPSNRRFSIGQTRKEQAVEVPSLDKFLVKHMSKLEREVQEAKSKRKNDSKGRSAEDRTQSIGILSEAVPDLGSILVKHASKLEKEIEEAKRTIGKEFELKCKRLEKIQEDVPSLDKFLVKHVSRLEREVQEARNRRKNGPIERGVAATRSHGSASSREQTEKQEMVYSSCEVGEQTEKQEMVNSSCEVGEQVGKENINLNKQADKVLDVGTIKDCAEMEQSEKQDTATVSAEYSSIDVCSEKKSLTIKTMSRIERAKLETMESFSFQNGDVMRGSDCSLDRILVKPVNRLEREKRQALASGMEYGTRTNKTKHERTNDPHCESLDKVLVKHVHRLEKEKMEFASKEEEKKVKSIDSEPKNCNDSLDQVLVKHQSRLEKGKLASQKQVDEIKHSKTRREERERELQEAWGGLSLGNLGSAQSRLEKEKLGVQQPSDESKHLRTRREERDRELQEAWGGLGLGNAVRPHLSRLEREKAAWKKADTDEESRRARRDIET